MKTTVNRIGGVTAVLGGLYLLIVSLIQAFYGSDVEDTGLFWQLLPFLAGFLVLGAFGLWSLANGVGCNACWPLANKKFPIQGVKRCLFNPIFWNVPPF